jgi:AraC family transcriptional regulator
MDSIGHESIGVRNAGREHGFEKFGGDGLIASSVDFCWSGLSAELRAHDRRVITKKCTKPETEVCVAICPSNSLVTRLTGGVVDRTIAERGTIWLSPPDTQEILVDVAAPLPQMLHMYLPARHFSAESLGVDIDHAAHASLRYQRSLQDPLVAEIAFAIASELRTQTAGGRLLAETLAVSLAARLVHTHSDLFPDIDLEQRCHQGLDQRRLPRVREYIDANLEGGNLTLARPLTSIVDTATNHNAAASASRSASPGLQSALRRTRDANYHVH